MGKFYKPKYTLSYFKSGIKRLADQAVFGLTEGITSMYPNLING